MNVRKQALVGGAAVLAAAAYYAYVSTSRDPSGTGGYYDERGHWIVPIPQDLQKQLEEGGKFFRRNRPERANPLPAAKIETVEDLATYAERHAPERLKKEFRQLARPCIRGETKKAEMATLIQGVSRIGGVPDLPKGMPWPERRGRPLAFIAQIDLASVTALDPEGLLPKEGFLYFFYDAVEQPWGFQPDDRDGWRVFHHVGTSSELVGAPYPEGLDHKGRFAAAVPSFARGISYPESDTFYVEHLGLKPEESDRFDDIMERIRDIFPASGHQILGYAQQVQSAMEEECELASNGVYCGGTRPPDPRASALRAGGSKWLLLLQIDSDHNAGMMWGDVGRLYVWIRREDLKKRDFSHVWVVLQCG